MRKVELLLEKQADHPAAISTVQRLQPAGQGILVVYWVYRNERFFEGFAKEETIDGSEGFLYAGERDPL